jgi:Holliday junction DNA helicase RuvA
MIRMVRGAVIGRGKDYLVLDVGSAGGGIGFKVSVPEATAAEAAMHQPIALHTHLQVREDALNLFGFADEDELAIFEMLLSVSGVGPKVALSTISTLSPDALRNAIANDEPALIARVPGVGKRTAEKIVLDLRDKIKPTIAGLHGLAVSTDVDVEVIEALIALGYSVVEAQRAVQRLPKDAAGVEDRLRMALAQFTT